MSADRESGRGNKRARVTRGSAYGDKEKQHKPPTKKKRREKPMPEEQEGMPQHHTRAYKSLRVLI
jgi:hypothetical protein